MDESTRYLHKGIPVFTRDGEQLGTVAEVFDEAFRVDVSWRQDYWLAIECVVGADGDHVVLAFDRRELDTKRIANPHVAQPDAGPDRAATLLGMETGLSSTEREERGYDVERHHIS